MKIRTKHLSYEQVLALPAPKHARPMKPLAVLRGLIRLLSIPDMLATHFRYTESRMELIDKKQPCLILMNHSSFIDLKIAYRIFFPKPFCIVSTHDSYIGKRWLMPLLGCIPTHKFIPDISLMTDIKYAIETKKTSVLMFPEAGYTLDGRTTALPQRLGMLIKRLNVPVVTVITEGAFLRQPLYNELRTRKVRCSAEVTCLLTTDEIKEKSIAELDSMIENVFSFDNFKTQYETKTVIDDKERAVGLERLLYKCPHCKAECKMKSANSELRCESCGKVYKMDIYGRLKATNGETEFSHIPDWVDWERETVKAEIENKEYLLDTEVEISIIKDNKALYSVGTGRLVHDENGFTLNGCDGKLSFSQPPLTSHSINADFYWYTIGDIICIGNKDILYYCFVNDSVSVFKARLAAEEMYKIQRASKRRDNSKGRE